MKLLAIFFFVFLLIPEILISKNTIDKNEFCSTHKLSREFSIGMDLQLRISKFPEVGNKYVAGVKIQTNLLRNKRLDLVSGFLFEYGRTMDTRGVVCFQPPCIHATLDELRIEIPVIARFYILKDYNRTIRPSLDFGFQSQLFIGGLYKDYSVNYLENEYSMHSKKYFSLFNTDYSGSINIVTSQFVIGTGITFNLEKQDYYIGMNYQGGAMHDKRSFQYAYDNFFDMSSLNLICSIVF